MKVNLLGCTLEIDETLVLNRKPEEIEGDIHLYLKGERRRFDDYEVRWKRFTPFGRRVLHAVREIPPGATTTYGTVARKIGRPEASRPVGKICAENPLPLVIPCHRVVGENSLGGYLGGKKVKKKLLRMELSQSPLSPAGSVE